MRNSYRIVFMGTPHFAVPALKSLSGSRHSIELVVSQPDRPRGRGKVVVSTPVKQAALDMNYPIIQPFSARTLDFHDKIAALNPDLIIVVAYGHVLPQSIIEIPRFGAINIHASLLPKYRGPAPIQWAVINMEKETGVTIMKMDKGLDTGDILSSSSIRISSDDTSESLHLKLSMLGAGLLIETLDYLQIHLKNAKPQSHEHATHAPLLKKEDGHINWAKPAEETEALIRGLTPWPGAFCFCNGKRLKIFKAAMKSMQIHELPGTVLKGFSDEITVATGKNALVIQELQGDSGKRLPVRLFLQGYPILPGTVLT